MTEILRSGVSALQHGDPEELGSAESTQAVHDAARVYAETIGARRRREAEAEAEAEREQAARGSS